MASLLHRVLEEQDQGHQQDDEQGDPLKVVQVGEELRLVGEAGVRTNPAKDDPFLPGDTGRFAMVGLIYSPTDKIDLDIGYRKGLNDAEPDWTVLIGATFRW